MATALPHPAHSALARLAEARFVPVVRASSGAKALTAARAFLAGGCRALEIALTVPGAAEVIRTLAAEGHHVGAGTVLDAASAREVIAAGARYLVGPTTEPDVIDVAREAGVLVVPGALTPNEVLAAHRAGAQVIKVFPVSSLGGPRYLRLLNDPFPHLRFFASGGVSLEDAKDYLAAGAVALGIGGALVNAARVEAEDTVWLETEARRWCEALHA
jgi:2-dehydro-3-deoxyphosphogluconate aldolase/(4S)-4-hydroxy-2-oxoglutarate aldolase